MLRDPVRAGWEPATGVTPTADQSSLLQRLDQAIARAGRAAALQRDFATLGLTRADGPSVRAAPDWAPTADGVWLVSLAPVRGAASPALVAVNVRRFLQTAAPLALAASQASASVGLAVEGDAPGEPLGAGLPGIRVSFTDAPEDVLARAVGLQRSLSLVVLVVVLSITLFGGYLLWRDVRREVRLAALRSHFVSSVSHELKTPLTAIRMFAETLRARDRPDPTMQADYLDTIVGESERLTRLLNNVLDHSKIEQDQKICRREPASLAEVLRRAASATEYPLRQGGFGLGMETENGLPPVSIDADAVEQESTTSSSRLSTAPFPRQAGSIPRPMSGRRRAPAHRALHATSVSSLRRNVAGS
jgi:signal transduction histidine kinase